MKQKYFRITLLLAVLFVIYAWGASFGAFKGEYIVLRQLNRLFAAMGFLFFFVQFVLASRIKLLEKGFGQDKMIGLHRLLGRIALGFLLLHPFFFFLYQGEVVVENVFRVIGIVILLGLIVTAAVASLYKKLNLPYELWLHVHKVNYVLFPLVLIHVFYNALPGTLLYYLWVAFAVLFAALILYKVLREIIIRKVPYEVVEVKKEAKDIWSLYFKGRPLPYDPGQFMYLRLVRNGKVSSSHPFTISSSPTRELLSVTPKELGDFTATVKDTQVGDQAYIDAPYGVFSYLNYDCKKMMFLAGGIGITPFMSMLRYMYDKKSEKPVTLLWGNKNEEMLCFQEELNRMEREMKHLKIVYVMSRQEDWPGETGRIDRKMIEKYTENMSDYDFFVCGPPPMSKAALEALGEMGIPQKKIHHELFEF
ncbi:MAG: ferredoxin reductase family protein [Bacillota bacterium]|nr:ferredoxin reductase family protein [Bacillota bacterium]MDW7682616.1 ferredoxin reductase family protein [Bacillota bacterium]